MPRIALYSLPSFLPSFPASFLPSLLSSILVPAMVLLLSNPALAQSSATRLDDYTPVSAQLLAAPPEQDWLMWRQDYQLGGHSPLDQINRSSVADLKLAWTAELGQGGNMTTPLVHDGVMFIADTGNVLRVLDAGTGEELWQYTHESDNFDGRRIGVALQDDLVIVPHNDLDVVALNVRSGEVVWDHSIQTPDVAPNRGGYYSLRAAPVIADGMVIQGVGATIVPEGGFIVGIDLQTGQEKWRFHTVARPDGPGGNTWNDIPLSERSGGSVWIPGSYDPELNLLYFGSAPTYDTEPLRLDAGIEGHNNDALFTNTTLALRPQTGELVWYYQHLANDQWDLDWVYERQIVELEIDGQMRKVVLTAGKMALYDVLDAASGDYLMSLDLGIQNMIASIDPETGAKTMAAITTPNAEMGNLLCPYMLGGRNWQSASLDSDNNMLYLPLSEMCMMGGPIGDGGLLSSGVEVSPRPRPDSDGNYGRLQAVNLDTMELAWRHREMAPPGIAALSTAGGLVFTGFLDQSFKAFDAASGEVLWQTDLEHLPSSFPISYAVDGTQYIAVIRGQPSRFIGSLYGIINGLLAEQGKSLKTPTVNPAIMVYSVQ